MTLEEYPGFPLLSAGMQRLLVRAQEGDDSVRPALLQAAADVANVFVGLDLLQYVFMTPPHDEAGPAGIDLIAPPDDAPAIAWFSVTEAGYDEFRDAVTLFGELSEVLNPPIVLEDDAGAS